MLCISKPVVVEPPKIEEKATFNVNLEAITFVSYNVWFGSRSSDPNEYKDRISHLLDLIQQKKPEVICLQEVTPPIIEIIKKQQWIKDDYWMSYPDWIPQDGYGNIIISSLPIHKHDLSIYDFPSKFGRKVLIGKFTINDEPVLIATSHLESYDKNKSKRLKQWKYLYFLLSDVRHTFFMGDCNFANDEERNSVVKRPYVDLWANLHLDDPGYTYDSEKNTMLLRNIKELNEEEKQLRIDLIISKSSGSKFWKPAEAALLGTEPISPSSDLFPSDHFGVWGKYVYSEKKKKKKKKKQHHMK